MANNISMVSAGRTIQGIRAGGTTAVLNVIIADLIPLRERGKWFGYAQANYSVTSVIAPIIGGAFAERAS